MSKQQAPRAGLQLETIHRFEPGEKVLHVCEDGPLIVTDRAVYQLANVRVLEPGPSQLIPPAWRTPELHPQPAPGTTFTVTEEAGDAQPEITREEPKEPREGTIRAHCLKAIRTGPRNGLTTEQVAARIIAQGGGTFSHAAVSTQLSRMMRQGRLVRINRRYQEAKA